MIGSGATSTRSCNSIQIPQICINVCEMSLNRIVNPTSSIFAPSWAAPHKTASKNPADWVLSRKQKPDEPTPSTGQLSQIAASSNGTLLAQIYRQRIVEVIKIPDKWCDLMNIFVARQGNRFSWGQSNSHDFFVSMVYLQRQYIGNDI
jgi:hypothetical protein